ncbi:hypothetical protein ACET3Z_027834 [Daucus carota]
MNMSRCEKPPSPEPNAPPPRNAPKAVDEDLCKISPDLCYAKGKMGSVVLEHSRIVQNQRSDPPGWFGETSLPEE